MHSDEQEGKVMKEQAYWIDQNGMQQSQWIHHEGHEGKKWIARNGSGQGFVSYTLILCCVSVVAAISFGLLTGMINSLLYTAISSMP